VVRGQNTSRQVLRRRRWRVLSGTKRLSRGGGVLKLDRKLRAEVFAERDGQHRTDRLLERTGSGWSNRRTGWQRDGSDS
jgi:hypothetical protein